MPHIPYPDVSTLPDTVRTMLEGTPLNVVRIGAHASPELFQAQGQLGWAIAKPDVLAPPVRETTILRVAYLSNSAYELHHHIPLGKAAGLTDAELTAIATQDYAGLDPLLAAVARFTDEVVVHLAPSAATLDALRAHVPDRVLVNILLTIGCYMSIARLIAATGIEIDDHPLQHLASGTDDPSH